MGCQITCDTGTFPVSLDINTGCIFKDQSDVSYSLRSVYSHGVHSHLYGI